MRGLKVIALLCAAGLLLLSPFSSHPWLAGLLALVLVPAVLGLPGSARGPAAHASISGDIERGSPEGRLHAVLDALSAATILIDARGAVVRANEAAMAAFPGLRVGTPLAHVIRAPAMVAALESVQRGAPSVRLDLVEHIPLERSFEVSIRPLGGGQAVRGAGEENTVAPWHSAAGVAHAVVFMPETTAGRRLEAMRVDFVANASHELRTPLASILGFVETLRGPAKNDANARERFLAIMEEQARRMARLIEDLLSLSKIELSEHIPPTGVLEVSGAIRSVLDALSGLARERNVTFEIDFPPGEYLVPGQRDEVLRVFENLVENAIKYGQSGGRVRIALHAEEDAVIGSALRISVQDFGPGIAAEHVPRLTERFYRADVNASRGQGGTGLGLAIVKHIVTRHRGRLSIDSRPGAGATFTILLPRARNIKKDVI